MTPLLLFLATVGAGGVGAVLRFLLDTSVTGAFARRGRPPRASWAIAGINVLGSAAIGGLSAGVASGLPLEWVTVLGAGLLGGFTTFSAASGETVRLLRDRRWGLAFLFGPVQLLLAVLAAGSAWALLGTA